jgi:hypothetical protein
MNENQSPGVPGNAFPQLLSVLENGDTQNEASQKLTKLVERVTALGKPGKLVLTLTVEKAGGTAVNFEADITLKMPKLPADKTLMFVDTENGFVLMRNRKQMDLSFSEIPKPEPQVAEELPKPDLSAAQVVG